MTRSTPAEPDISRPKTFEDLFSRGLLSVVRDDYGRVGTFLAQSVDSKFELVPQVVRHLIDAGGKRIRPVVHCLASRLCGYEGDGHIVLASVSEMIHSATLFHDDVVDNGKVRRGRPTANEVWGNQIPVLVGDFVFARAFTIMMDHGFYSISSHLGRTVQDLVQGELLQLTHAGNPMLRREVYDEIIRCKTASLFSWCGRAAAMLSELSDERTEKLARVGHHFGMAFQITDDVLDYAGASADTGKGSCSDLAEGKVTLPLIVAAEQDRSIAADLQVLLATDEDPDPALAESIARRVVAGQGVTESIRIAEQHVQSALTGLDAFPPSASRDALAELCRFSLSRIH